MPSAKKVAWAQLRVGIVAVVALVLLAVLVFLITGTTSLFQKYVTIYTYLSDSAALTKSSAVRLNGMLIGEVTAVQLAPTDDPRKVVRVAMKVYDNMLPLIPTDSVAGISAENVLGSKYINIKKGKAPTPLKPGGELSSKDTSEFEQVVEQGYSVLASAQEMLKRMDKIVQVIEKGQGSIGKLIYDDDLYDNLNKTVVEAKKIIDQANSGKGTLGRILYDDVLIEDFRGTIARLNSLLQGLERGEGTAGLLLKDKALYDDVRRMLAEYRKVAVDLNAGKGTAGKLLKDEALHKQIQDTIARMDSLLDKINKGEGTLGQLAVNPQLYESLNGFTRELHDFMKDFRKNPKKFLSIKLSLF